MTKFYSPSTRGFYSDDVHLKAQIPNDVVEITDEKWRQLLIDNANGKTIDHGADGKPFARDQNDTEIGPARRRARDQLLKDTDWLIQRHRDELDADEKITTLSKSQIDALQTWRAKLRALPEDPNWPRVQFPPRPEGV